MKARKTLLPCLSLRKSEKENIFFGLHNLENKFDHKILQESKINNPLDEKEFHDSLRKDFNFFPLVLNADGSPWAEAVVYLLSKLEDDMTPNMGTYSSIADDLAAYRRFLEENFIDWTKFPQRKIERPTYRYRARIILEVQGGALAMTTGRRRMNSIISFYKWWISEKSLTPDFAPWESSDKYFHYHGVRSLIAKKITQYDISIKSPKKINPYSQYIDDGGSLKPLSIEEQGWLIETLIKNGNTELFLIHLFSLLTGARIQTILTFRLKNAIELDFENSTQIDVPVVVGPGTDVDTKNGKKMVIYIPVWFCAILRTYAVSDRASIRRKRSAISGSENQYLFLTIRGSPFYTSRSELQNFNDANRLHHIKAGGAVRQLIKDYILPAIQNQKNKSFYYKFHDLRATFGMNYTDDQLRRVQNGEITLHQARENVMVRMGHESSVTTDLYINYRGRVHFASAANNKYSEYLREVAAKAFEGLI